MSDVRTVYTKARAETAKLLGYGDDLEQLTAEQSTRLDIACALRIALDDQAAKLLRGESADVTKLLSASEALGRILPPTVLASPPPANSPDPRQVMWQTYLGMRRRGELADPTSTYEGQRRRIAELEARVAELEAAASPAPDNKPTLASPLPDNVVKLPPATSSARASPQPSKPAPPQPAAASAPVLGDLVMVVDPSPDEEWKSYVEPTGEIRSTPFGGGKYWGPV